LVLLELVVHLEHPGQLVFKVLLASGLQELAVLLELLEPLV
jgi:hypothetical protein